MLFSFIYVVILTLPGVLLLLGLRFSLNQSFLIPALSLAWWAVVVVVSRAFEWGATGFRMAVLASISFLALIAARRVIADRFSVRSRLTERFDPLAGAVALVFVVYARWAGPYLELPGDALWHLSLVQDEWQRLMRGELNPGVGRLTGVFSSHAHYSHLLHAFVAWISGAALTDTYQPVWIINGLLLVLSVYSFAAFLFAAHLTRVWARIAALLAVCFFALHFGISAFSYLRYYAFAPAGLGYINFLAGAGLLIMFLRAEAFEWKTLFSGGVVLFVAAAWHSQEALLLLLLAAGLLLLNAIRWLRGRGKVGMQADFPDWNTTENWKPRLIVVLAVFAVLGYGLIHGYLFNTVVRQNPLAYGRLVSLSGIHEALDAFFVLNPQDQLFKLLTLWGVWVYGIWLLARQAFRGVDFINVGMWLPVFTLLNPLFTDFFLRLSFPEVFWRLGFAIPLYFAAAYWVAKTLEGGLHKMSWVQRAPRLLAMLGLGLFLLPLHLFGVQAPWAQYSKLWMLKQQSEASDYRHWQDMLTAVDRYPEKKVLTDPVTGYLVNAHTRAMYPGLKFMGIGALSSRQASYSLQDLQPYAGGLLLINLRDGDLSAVGTAGGHWAGDIRSMGKHYHLAFTGLIRQCPDAFRLVWEAPKIDLYEIAKQFRCKALVQGE